MAGARFHVYDSQPTHFLLMPHDDATPPGTVPNLSYAQNVLSCATEPDESTPVFYQVGGEHARNMW